MRILLLEDNPADAELIEDELRQSFSDFVMKWVVTEEDFTKELREYCPDIILSDYDLPRYNGALALADARRLCPDVPFILVTGAVTEDRAIEILTSGAKDYVLKTRLQQRLVPAVQRALAEANEHKERMRASEDLHKASLYSRSLIEASIDPLVTISSEGKVMDVNKATEEMTGVSRERIIGSDFSDYFSDPEKAREGYKKVFSEGSVKDYPLAIRHITGRVTDVLYNASTYRNEKGEIQGVFAAARDVTELKKAEEELRISHKTLEERVKLRTAELEFEIAARKKQDEEIRRQRELLRVTLSSIGDAVISTDSMGRVMFMNGIAEALTGWPLREASQRPIGEIFNIINEHTREAVESPVARVLNEGTIVGLANHTILIRRDGTEVPIDDSGAPIRVMGGTTLGVVLVFRDITERKKSEKQLASEIYLQQLLLDHFPGVVLLLRKATREIVASNKAGIHVGAVCGSTCYETWGQNKDACPWCLAPDLWATGKEQHVVLEAGDKVMEAHWVPVTDDLYMHYAFDITERKRAEEKLQEKEQIIQQALSISRSFTFDWDVATDQVQRSTSCREIFGSDGDEIVNDTAKRFSQRVHPADRSSFEAVIHNLTPAADTYTTNFRLILTGGNVMILDETAQGFFDAAGKLTRVIGVATDITGRKRAEEDVQQQAQLLDLSYDAIFTWDLDGAIQYWNEGAERLYGYSRDEAVGRVSHELLGTRHPISWAELKTDLVRDGVWSGELSQLTKAGSKIVVESRHQLLHRDGRLIVLETCRDITERRRAEDELHQEHERFHTTLTSIGDGVISTDAAGRITFMNPVAEALTGWSLREAFDRPTTEVFNIINEQTRRTVENPVARVLKEGMVVGLANHTILVRKDGTEVPIDDSGAPIRDANGQILGVVLVFRDISERKKSEAALQETFQHLKASVSNLHGSIVLMGESGIVMANQAYCDYFGLQDSPDDLIGLTPQEIQKKIKNAYLHPDEQLSRIQEIIEEDKPVIGEEIAMKGGRTCLRDYIPIGKDGKTYGHLWDHTDITGQKKAEAEMARLASFPLLNPNPIIEVDLAGIIHFCNPAAERLFPGLCQGEKGHPLLADLKEFVSSFRGMGLEQNTRDVNFNDRWYQQAINVVEKTEHIRIYISDITERKKAEEGLLAAKDQLELRVRERTEELRSAWLYARNLIEVGLDPMVTISREGKITDVNHATELITGVARDRLVGSDFFDYFTEPDSARKGYRKVLADGQIRDYPLTIRATSGSMIDVLYNATVYRDAEGKVQGVLAAARDITERKKAEDRVKDERQRLYDVLETMPAMICLLTPDYHVAFANRAFREKFGESGGRHCYEYCFGFAEPCNFCESYKVLETGKPHHWEVTAPDGGSVIDAYDFPFTDVDGSPLILEMDIDITEQKQMQKMLGEINETLEQRVAERTEQLKEANKELERFSYTVSHDLQAPLRAIKGFSQMIQKDEAGTGAETKRKLVVIQENAERMQQLIDDLLALSRVGRQGVSLQTIEMNTLVKDVWEELKAAYHEKPLALKMKDLRPAYGDQTLIRQVLANLLTNAIKFSANRKRIEVEVGSNQKNGDNVYYVKDKGAGFDMKYYDKLFGVFQRLHNSSEFQGTGIGLSIVQRIVHLHGGKVWAEGKVDEGATFYFLLPGENKKLSR